MFCLRGRSVPRGCFVCQDVLTQRCFVSGSLVSGHYVSGRFVYVPFTAGNPSVYSWTSPLSHYLGVISDLEEGFLRYFEEEFFQNERNRIIIQIYKDII